MKRHTDECFRLKNRTAPKTQPIQRKWTPGHRTANGGRSKKREYKEGRRRFTKLTQSTIKNVVIVNTLIPLPPNTRRRNNIQRVTSYIRKMLHAR